MFTEPVALTSATLGSSTSCPPAALSPRISGCTPLATPASAAAAATSAWQASEVSGVSADGFHTTVSPQTSATAVFQAQTAAGKLNAEITPTTPSGCHASDSRWP